MKTARARRNGWRVFTACLFFLGLALQSQGIPLQPVWWTERNVLTTNEVIDNAPVNQGQIKWMASQAYAEFQEKLPGAANSNITTVVSSFTPENNYLPANVGQLKHVATPFYDRLMGLGLVGHYPWKDDASFINDFAIATIGQLKTCFNFEAPAGTTIYYVSTTGSDESPGTFDMPFRTIQHAANLLVPGDTVLIRGGTYRERVDLTASGTLDKPITIMGYKDEFPVIKGSDVVTNWVHYQNNIWMVTNWTVTSQQVFDNGLPLQQIGYPSQNYVSNNITCYSPVGLSIEDMIPGSFFYDEETFRLYVWLDNDNPPPAEGLEVSTKGCVWKGDSAAHTRLSRLRFMHSSTPWWDGTLVYLGPHSTISNSEMAWGHFSGLCMGDQSSALDCTIRNNGACGIGGHSVTNVLIAGCTITHNNYRSFDPGWHAGGIKLIPDCSGTVEGCEVGWNNGHGIWFDFCSTGNRILIRNNLIHHNLRGVFAEVTENADICNNLIIGNESGVWVAESDNVRVFNNTIVSSHGAAGIYSRVGEDRTGGTNEVSNTFSGNRYFNNLLYNNSSVYDITLPGNTSYIYDNLSDYNCIYRDDGPALFGRDDEKNSGLTAWQQNSGQDQHSIETHPLLLNPALTNYDLSARSPCIDGGTNLTELANISYDLMKRSRLVHGIIDIGAFEFNGFDHQTRPEIRITDPGRMIPYDVNTLSGTLNANTVGDLYAEIVSPGSTNWIYGITFENYVWVMDFGDLDIGEEYTITIFGTNSMGTVEQETIILTRGDVGTGAPSIDIITPDPLVITNGAAFIEGTNNLHVSSRMTWSNRYEQSYLSGGAFSASNGIWNLSIADLYPGWNEIHVFGTNDWGVEAFDTIMVQYGGVASHYVSTNSPNPIYPYLTWNTAALTIQEAVDASHDGDTVWVSNGVYQTGFVDHADGRTRVLLDRGIRLRSVNGPEGTIILGSRNDPEQSSTRCITVDHIDADLIGFTLRDGVANGRAYGGGLMVLDAHVISNCIITSCYSPYNAGGVCVWGQNDKGHGLLTDCSIVSNTAAANAGGMLLQWGNNITIDNCIISDNLTEGKAGGLLIDNCRNIRNCLIKNNTAGTFGGGVVLGNSASIYHCTVENNQAASGGGVVIDSPFGSGACIYNSVFYWNTPDNFSLQRTNPGKPYKMEYSCTDTLPTNLTSVAGSITNNPLYIYPYGDNYLMASNSPCLDAASSSYVNETPALNDTDRVLFGLPDMGCYEYDAAPEMLQPFVEIFCPTGWIANKLAAPLCGGKNVNVDTMEVTATTNGVSIQPVIASVGPYDWQIESIDLQPDVTNTFTVTGRNEAGNAAVQTFTIILSSEP